MREDSFWRSLRAEGEIFLGAGADGGGAAAAGADDVDGAGVSLDMAAAKRVVIVAGNVITRWLSSESTQKQEENRQGGRED